MSGSWNHMVNDNGTPRDERFGEGPSSSLNNPGDVVEALEQCYGMIWYLATEHAREQVEVMSSPVTRDDVLRVINEAQESYKKGLKRGKSRK
jgi:hypothetical protein